MAAMLEMPSKHEELPNSQCVYVMNVVSMRDTRKVM